MSCRLVVLGVVFSTPLMVGSLHKYYHQPIEGARESSEGFTISGLLLGLELLVRTFPDYLFFTVS